MAGSASNSDLQTNRVAAPAAPDGSRPAATQHPVAPRFVEVAVFVPIKREYRPDAVDILNLAEEEMPLDKEFRLFHYAVPETLRDRLVPGHLVNVPFGPRPVQGIAIRMQHTTPVPARDVLSLARPQPVLRPYQIRLAAWIGHYYVASLAACLALFVPPGVLSRTGGKGTARAKYDWHIQLRVAAADFVPALLRLGRTTQQSRVLAWMLDQPHGVWTRPELQAACNLPSSAALRTLQQKGWIAREADAFRLARPVAEVRQHLLDLKGIRKYLPWLEAIATCPEPVWKSDLGPATKLPLQDLRWLAEHDLIDLQRRQRFRDPLAGAVFPPSAALTLTAQQQRVWEQLEPHLERTTSQTVLLQGVTGSGKTEIYLRAIQACQDRGRQAIVLVPEIALTPQTVRRFGGRFPGRVSVMHSRLSPGERYDVWRLVQAGEVDVLIGPRSALFAPMPRLGLIVIDEEHDDSYKQNAEEWGDQTVFYDARRVAEELGRIVDACVLMGSATPSLQMLHRVFAGELPRLSLPHRVRETGQGGKPAPLPPIELVDMRQELMAGNLSVFSRALKTQLRRVIAQREQAILYINRRGTRSFVNCRACGHVLHCRVCSTPLTYHEDIQRLQCHTCAREFAVPKRCPVCEDHRIRFFGSGTQLIVKELHHLLPTARVLRWDADSTRAKGQHQAIMERFRTHQADILVGTQMVAKGLDLPRVTLVGVVAADVGLFLPDFRAPERTCQLLIQVAGRAGRSERGGRVVIQTYAPDHYCVQAAATHNYDQFCRRELRFRQEMAYPPHQRLARLVYWDKNAVKAEAMAREMADSLHRARDAMPAAASPPEIVGPTPPFYERVRSYWRWQILILGENPAALIQAVPLPHGWRVDLDPVSTL